MTELNRRAPDAHPSKKPRLITEFFAQATQKPAKKKSPVNVNKLKMDVTDREVAKSINNAGIAVKEVEKVFKETTTSVNDSADASAEPNLELEEESVTESTTPEVADDTKKKDYAEICAQFNFNKEEWINSLAPEQRQLLTLEINTMHISWLAALHTELTKPYFLKLKRFLHAQAGKTVFPPPGHIYSWSHYTPLPEVKCLILGQDPYHNFNQAHGLAFLVLEPTRPPPSLLNIYKTLKIDFPSFEIPEYKKLEKQGKPGGGNLTKWAKRGVLMLNACLTVEAHKANSHANQGWEQFTEQVIKAAITHAKDKKNGFVIMAWGSPAQKRVAQFTAQLNSANGMFLVLKTVHPSPLSASRGFFELKVFFKCNEWLREQGKDAIDWGLFEGNVVTGL
ncbi:CIC11C00000000093 [Sungouiella intermedia]|uniref:Uracil-DNA glycosylase n=1 Tax=Sungouiella intermedia TaxID=45354 RepID=A0A1L0GFI9_9ASCO|nr:CIC11C00000000093 [[Candida] intermedia]